MFLSRLVSRAGSGNRLYRFLIIAFIVYINWFVLLSLLFQTLKACAKFVLGHYAAYIVQTSLDVRIKQLHRVVKRLSSRRFDVIGYAFKYQVPRDISFKTVLTLRTVLVQHI